MLRHETVIHVEVGSEAGGNRRHHTFPLHQCSPMNWLLQWLLKPGFQRELERLAVSPNRGSI